FKEAGGKLTGEDNSEAGERKREAELKEGKVQGDAISFLEMLTIQDNEIRISYTGKLSADGDEIKFTREVGDFGKSEIVARREQGAPGARTSASASAPSVPPPAPSAPAGPAVLQIDAGKVTGKVSPRLYGLMTEEIKYAYEG